MKVSEITNELVANYMRLDFASMTDAEKAELTVLLAIAKAFVKSYTGLKDVSPEDEVVGAGDGVKTKFALDYYPVKAASRKIYIDKVEQTETTDYALDDDIGRITFVTTPANGVEITASYSAVPTDGFEDFVIVVYILVQDMYDNRTLYVDKNNLNKVVDMTLGMHSTNYL